MTSRRAVLSVFAAAVAGARPLQAAARDVVLFAAASLTDVLTELGPAFERANGVRLVFNLGASNDLARQIRAGAAADVFFSADLRQVDALEKEGLVRPGERWTVLSNALVVVVPAGSDLTLAAPDDLKRVRRLALADPEAVPAGVYAREWLESRGLWSELRDRIVPALNVRAALSAVEAGHAEAGIVYRTDAALTQRVRVAYAVPREEGPPIAYALAALANAPSPEPARALAAHLRSAEAARAYERHGFVVLAR